MKLSLSPKLGAKLVWVPFISFCKIFIPSYAFDALLCRNWPFSPPNSLTLRITLILYQPLISLQSKYWPLHLIIEERVVAILNTKHYLDHVTYQPVLYAMLFYKQKNLWFQFYENFQYFLNLSFWFLNAFYNNKKTSPLK